MPPVGCHRRDPDGINSCCIVKLISDKDLHLDEVLDKRNT